MICNEYVGLYFFSAVFQGNMALLALLGVFVVFKRQELTSELQGKDNAIVNFVQNYLDLIVPHSKHVAINYPNVEALPNVLLKMSNDQTVGEYVQARAKDLYEDDNFNARFEERRKLVGKRSDLLTLLGAPFAWVLSIIVISLVLLPLAHTIHTKTPLLEMLAIAITVLLNVYTLVTTKRYVWKVLGN